ncbi:MAG: M3 family metallopeptidase [Vicinamibacterales bacterium]
MPLSASHRFFDTLNHDYAAVHKAKEDLFWSTYMGLSHDDGAFAKAEQAFKDFISDPGRLRETREHATAVAAAPRNPERDALLHGLTGWQALFEAHIIENDEGRRLMHEMVEAEAALFAKRRGFNPQHLNEQGELVDATLGALLINEGTNPLEERRRSSFEALRGLEGWVLDNGFLELVALRNAFARTAGFPDYFEYKIQKNERMSRAELLAILDDFTSRTDAANARTLAEVRARHGESGTAPWNFRFLTTGDVTRRTDAYMGFGPALRRWVESFRRLRIGFRGATMQLDLLERAGKHQNGFCHAPICAWTDADGRWIPGQINFTSDARPDQVGSGQRAITTLFHEGGHAAHFANVTQNAPCFSQEYAPTSMAYAETQSMFCDSLLEDADWLKRYARNAGGDPMPDEIIREVISSRQPLKAYDNRTIAVVPYFESTLYAMSEAARTREAVLQLARDTERQVLGMESPRPMLAIPHLLNQESAASYQGYLLARMAVYQTRAFFIDRDGYLTDNPAIGPSLAEHYWQPGNSRTHGETLRSLTGEAFSAGALADECNRSVDEAWTLAQAKIDFVADFPDPTDAASSLDAVIRVVHGAEVLADSSNGEDAMCDTFEAWVAAHY